MPWKIDRNHVSCPASKSWAVVKIDDGEIEGCHRSRTAALRQLAALNAAEEGRMSNQERETTSSQALEFRTLDLPLAETRAEVRDGRTLVGYAAVFDRPVNIDSWKGRFTETVAPGAFLKTLVERRGQVQVLFNHGMDPAFGRMPLGRPEVIKEDLRGLRVEVPLFESRRNDEIIAAISSGALSGMSIQFVADKADWSDDHTQRTIREASLYEFGPVTFPTQPSAVAEIRCVECQRAASPDDESRDITHETMSRDSTFTEEWRTRVMLTARDDEEQLRRFERVQ